MYLVIVFFFRFFSFRFFSFFFSSHLLSSPFFSLSLLVVKQIRGHIAGPSPPSPPRFVPGIFNARKVQFFPRRLASNCAYSYPRYALSAGDPLFFFLMQIISKSHHGRIRILGPTLLIVCSIRGLPLVHRGDRCMYVREQVTGIIP